MLLKLIFVMMVLMGGVFTTFAFMAAMLFATNPDLIHPFFGTLFLSCFFLMWGYFGVVFSNFILK